MRRHAGFTLVELLVVAGIIVLLMALLLSVLAGVREQARRVQCANNLSHVTRAVMAYALDNQGYFPGNSGGAFPAPHDWLHYHRGRDLQQSRLARYVGRPIPEALLRCPSDDTDEHQGDDGGGPFRYSYTMNAYLTAPEDGPNSRRPHKLTLVTHPSDKLLMVEESEETINDGRWVPELDGAFGGDDWLASRHERRRELTDEEKDRNTGRRGRANASFADGHVDFISRRFAHDEAHVLMQP